MQIVIALPRASEMERLETPVCGVPLLTRVIATAVRAGGTQLLLIIPPGWPAARLTHSLRFRAIECVFVDAVGVRSPFDPKHGEAWRFIADHLEERFLWMPYDYLAHKPALTELLAIAKRHPRTPLCFPILQEAGPDRSIFEQPAVLLKRDLLDTSSMRVGVAAIKRELGVPARPSSKVRDIEAQLVRHTGKVTDGIYSRFNRRLCWPAVRWLSQTPVTPNTISLIGLAIGAVSAVCFAQGAWAWDIAAALLFFVSGMFDEIDGMLARLKFQESAFGCWLETFVDYATYLFAFAGMTVGGYRRGGPVYLAVGIALLLGCLLSFIVISVQRNLAAQANPTEYYQRYLKALDSDGGNLISKLVRNLQFMLRKGVLIHYILLFAVLNLMPVVLFLAAFGANAAWTATLYLNRRLFTPKNMNRRLARSWPARTEVVR
jgi:phosphatidylglycerophosphate synthase